MVVLEDGGIHLLAAAEQGVDGFLEVLLSEERLSKLLLVEGTDLEDLHLYLGGLLLEAILYYGLLDGKDDFGTLFEGILLLLAHS